MMLLLMCTYIKHDWTHGFLWGGSLWGCRTERTNCGRSWVCSSSTGQGTVTQGSHLTAEARVRLGARKLLELNGTPARHQCGEHLSTFAWLACTPSRTALGVYSCRFVHTLWLCVGTVVLFFPSPYHARCSLERNLQLSAQLCSLRRKLVAFLMCHFWNYFYPLF